MRHFPLAREDNTFVSVTQNMQRILEAAIIDMLESKGFRQSIVSGERVFERNHESDERLKVRIWSTIFDVPNHRPRTHKTINIYSVFETNYRTYTLGLYSVPIVKNQQIVLDTILEAARNAYRRATEWSSNKLENEPKESVSKNGGYAVVDVPKTPLDGF